MNDEHTQKFTTFFKTNLNPEQQKVVAQKNGVLLVCAGAGSGKTRVITARMTNLVVQELVAPASIIALTFTNKAAHEMKERILSFLPEHYAVPYVGTFHSYCLRLLKSNSHLIRIPQFAILDSDDHDKLLRSILTRYSINKKITPKSISYALSQLKNNAIDGTINLQDLGDATMVQVCTLYEQEKTASQCLDFDDLLVETLRLFIKNPEFKERYQQHIRHVLVDEYQDTNRVQHALLKHIACDSQQKFALDSLCVVGDEDQSIYSWRGATVTNIINFKHDFPETTSITIEQNYRSVQPILDTANCIIKNNIVRNHKNLWSERKASDRIRLISCVSGYQEGEAVALFAKNSTQKTTLAATAVLYRSHYQSRTLEEALIRHAVPYKIVGGLQFYERLEIKDLLGYMRLVANPFDRVSFMRAFNTPTRGLGDKFQELFFQTWDTQPFLTFKGVANTLITNNLVVGGKQDALKKFIHIFDELLPTDLASFVLDTLITKTQYLSYLKEAFDVEEAATKIENVKELVHAIRAMNDHTPTPLTSFLDDVALLQEQSMQANQERDCIKLMTFHAAKGLEFDSIILTGLEEGILPSAHSLYEPERLEEERRLLYVGITRARERLLILHARYRYTFGQMTDQRSSRFLDEIPEDYMSRNDASQWIAQQFTSYFNQWLNQVTHTIKPAIIEKPVIKKLLGSWKKFQAVTHEKFGTGIIEKVEEKEDQKIYLTVKFKTGSKKLDAQFLK